MTSAPQAAEPTLGQAVDSVGSTDEICKPFRFKTKTSARAPDSAEHVSRCQHHRRRYHGSSSQHHRKKRKLSPSYTDDPSAIPGFIDDLPSEAAFRESLFDAMGDDEGASYWEAVYGQPIHNYPNTYQNGATGELERMSEDEYAQYVRRKMWEKSCEGIEASKEERRREKAQERRKAEAETTTQHATSTPKDGGYVFDFEIEQSLRRGEQRKRQKRWRDLWNDYSRRWEDLQALARNQKENVDNTEQLYLRNRIAWPIESGKWKDLSSEAVRRFISSGAKQPGSPETDHTGLQQVLKLERVRWHPDKIQHRFGFMTIDEDTRQGVTAVFQIVDEMWNELRT